MTEDILRTIKTGYCSSLSGRTTLTYHVGWLEGTIYIQLHENSSGGLFSKEWVSLEQIGVTENLPVTSSALQSLFKGRSANTGGFLMAVLLGEGLIKPIEGKRRSYAFCDQAAFNAMIQALVDAEDTAQAPTQTPKRKRKEAA